ncbi:MAG: hypothetical protein CMC90_02360 [Flavobacteriaceae bacterium]|nr:hypothetical protein [Flavobacteriaceae bacterium]|tara:strand:- start:2667 stop:3188 length:522 start_codon:yes stop_codon:yes gene_type:complete
MRLLTLILLLTSYNLISQEIKRIDSDSSSINYSGKHFLHKWSAENTNISGLVNVEDENIVNIGVIAKVADFKSGNSSLDSNALRVLEALQFPNIIFKSVNIDNQNKELQIDGLIEFHGIEKNISVIAELTKIDDMYRLNGEFTINLSNFLIERPSLLLRKIDDEIFIKFNLFY